MNTDHWPRRPLGVGDVVKVRPVDTVDAAIHHLFGVVVRAAEHPGDPVAVVVDTLDGDPLMFPESALRRVMAGLRRQPPPPLV